MSNNPSDRAKRRVVIFSALTTVCGLPALYWLWSFLFGPRSAGASEASALAVRAALYSRCALALGMAALVFAILTVTSGRAPHAVKAASGGGAEKPGRDAPAARMVVIGIASMATLASALISLAGLLLPFLMIFPARPADMPAMDAPGLEFIPCLWGLSIVFGIATFALAKATVQTVKAAKRKDEAGGQGLMAGGRRGR